MVTSQSGHTKINQQELSVLFSNIYFSTSSHVQQQETMTNQDGLQDPHLDTINLYTSEDLKIYNKAIIWLPESVRYDLIIYKWTNFYQLWIILYQLLDSKQQFWLWKTEIHSMQPLNSMTSSCSTHPSHKSWWTPTMKSCGMTALEQVWEGTRQQIMNKQHTMYKSRQ